MNTNKFSRFISEIHAKRKHWHGDHFCYVRCKYKILVGRHCEQAHVLNWSSEKKLMSVWMTCQIYNADGCCYWSYYRGSYSYSKIVNGYRRMSVNVRTAVRVCVPVCMWKCGREICFLIVICITYMHTYRPTLFLYVWVHIYIHICLFCIFTWGRKIFFNFWWMGGGVKGW